MYEDYPFPLEPRKNELVLVGKINLFTDYPVYRMPFIDEVYDNGVVYLKIENPELNCEVYFS
jgi:hypothetical protein